MSWDEALLECAAETTVRLYDWNVPTVSLGCFQDHDAIRARLPEGLPLVRRITGGGAIWHEHEVTFSLVGELGTDGLPERTAELYPLLHGAVRAALAARGATLEAQPTALGDRRYQQEPRCFASPAVDDLVLGGGKVLGSAARARGRRLLIHGSLKLASNPWDGPQVVGCGLDAAQAAAAVLDGLTAVVGRSLGPAQAPHPDETTRMHELRAVRYGDERWVRRREGLRP
jgi:lipoate-protein ligase A